MSKKTYIKKDRQTNTKNRKKAIIKDIKRETQKRIQNKDKKDIITKKRQT